MVTFGANYIFIIVLSMQIIASTALYEHHKYYMQLYCKSDYFFIFSFTYFFSYYYHINSEQLLRK